MSGSKDQPEIDDLLAAASKGGRVPTGDPEAAAPPEPDPAPSELEAILDLPPPEGPEGPEDDGARVEGPPAENPHLEDAMRRVGEGKRLVLGLPDERPPPPARSELDELMLPAQRGRRRLASANRVAQDELNDHHEAPEDAPADVPATPKWDLPEHPRMALKADGEPKAPLPASTLEDLQRVEGERKKAAEPKEAEALPGTEPFNPLKFAAARMALGEPDPGPPGPSPLESAGNPSTNSDTRVAVGDDPERPEAGPSPLESMGHPSEDAAGRLALGDDPERPQAGPSSLETYGSPSGRADDRLELGPDEDEGEPGPSPLESAGHPSTNSEHWFPVWPASQATPAGPTMESIGSPSTSKDDRLLLWEPEPADPGPSSLEAYGNPSDDPEGRLSGGTPKPPVGPSSLESMGHPARDPSERVDLGLPVPEWRRTGPTSESLGRPSGDASDRMGHIDPQGPGDDSSLESYGNPSREAAERMALVELPPLLFEPSPLESYGSPSADPTNRLGRKDPEAVPEASPLEAYGSPSRDLSDRWGRPGEDLVFEPSAVEGVGHPSQDPQDRFGRLTEEDMLAQSPVDGVGQPSTSKEDRIKRKEVKATSQNAPNGELELAMAVPILEGGINRFRREELPASKPHRPGLDPVPPVQVRMQGELSAAQAEYLGDFPRYTGEKVEERLDFLFQRFEVLLVHRSAYTTWDHPDAPPTVAELPHFAAGKVPLGNGMLAQVIAARYGDFLGLDQLESLFYRVWKPVSKARLVKGMGHAFTSVKPVLAAMQRELHASAGLRQEHQHVKAMHIGPERRTEGHIHGAASDAHLLLWYARPGDPDPLAGTKARYKQDLTEISEAHAAQMGWNLSGRWANVRRRFTVALATDPEKAARVLFQLHRLEQARVGEASTLSGYEKQLEALLRSERGTFEHGKGAYELAVVYTLQVWDRLVGDEAEAHTTIQPWRRDAQPWLLDHNEGSVEEILGWTSLVLSCSRLGIRPWTYLRDLFDAASGGELEKPEQWTPRAWLGRVKR